VLYLAGISWTLFYDTIYAYQDAEDDALIGVKSTARLFGDNARWWLRLFLALTVILFGAAVVLATQDRSVLSLVVALGGPLAMGGHLAWQLHRFDADNNEGLLRIFRSNRDAGLIPLPFFRRGLSGMIEHPTTGPMQDRDKRNGIECAFLPFSYGSSPSVSRLPDRSPPHS